MNPDEESRRRLKELQERANPQKSKPIQKTAQEELREIELREAEARQKESDDEAQPNDIEQKEEQEGNGAQILEEAKPDEKNNAGKLFSTDQNSGESCNKDFTEHCQTWY